MIRPAIKFLRFLRQPSFRWRLLMQNRNRLGVVSLLAVGLAATICSIAMAAQSKDPKPATAANPPEMPLPPGWTKADMQACMMAGIPGKMHEHLAKSVGVWHGKSTMWMYPG